MPQEIEIKYALASLAQVTRRLQELSARHVEDVLETDEFFDRPDGSMAAADCAIRLRFRQKLSGPSSHSSCWLTYKGPRQNAGQLKQRLEVETLVGDPRAMETILQEAGLKSSLTIQKRRGRWVLDDCHVELDELPLIGCFVEVEGPDGHSVQAAAQRLGLAGPAVSQTYVELLRKRCDELGRPFDRVLFEDC